MLARLYDQRDYASIKSILNGTGDVRLDRDRVFCIGIPGEPVGFLAWRRGGIVHELRVGNGMGRYTRASALVNFAVANALAETPPLWEALFVCDGDDMARFAKSIGAVEEEGKRLFSLPLR